VRLSRDEILDLADRARRAQFDQGIHGFRPSSLVRVFVDFRRPGPHALEHFAIAFRCERLASRFEMVGQELDVRIVFLQPRVVELAVYRRNARIALLACEDAVTEHQDLRLLDCEVPTLGR